MLGKSKVKYIQSLGQKKHRDEEGLFIAEGPKVLEELLASPLAKIKHVYALEEWIRKHPRPGAEIETIPVDEHELAKISQLTTPNQVLAVVNKFASLDTAVAPAGLCLALDTIQDPGNLGTILRIADWFGIPEIVCSPDSADMYNPKVVQSTMGSISRVRVGYTDLLAWLERHADMTVFATALQGKDVGSVEKPRQGVIIIGNESRGISPAIMQRVDVRITIPKRGAAESLNAAVATGIVLSHLV